MNYFEEQVKALQDFASVPLMTKRLDKNQPDPMDELLEVYDEVKEIEANLKKAIDLSMFILAKNQEILQVIYELQEELEIVDLERQTFEE